MKKVAKSIAAVLLGVAVARPADSQCQSQKLVALDAELGDTFGSTVALDGDWAAIAAPGEDDIQNNSGAVYMFHRVGGVWIEAQRLKASVPEVGSGFGAGVAITGDVLMVGAPFDDVAGFQSVGSVYVFELISNVWTQTARLVPNDPNVNGIFGIQLAMVSDRFVVGAPGADNRGAAYVFDRAGSSWSQSAKLTGSDSFLFDVFGLAVGIDGDEVIVGSRSHDGPAGSDQGAAYVYEKGTGGWVEVRKLLASDGGYSDLFGLTVAIHGTRAVVGALAHDHGLSDGGAAFTYQKTGLGWTQTQELRADDRALGDLYGYAVVISAEHIIVGAIGDDDNGHDSGSAYDYRWNGSSWSQTGKLLGGDSTSDDHLGLAIAMQGETVLLGAPSDDGACPGNPNCVSGSAYVFELAPTATQYGSCPSGSPCNNIDPHGGCRNGAGQGAIMAACGSGSITTDDLRLEVTRCPPNILTLLFMGPSQQPVIYGNGIRVASPQTPVGIYRYGGAAADSTGRVMRGPGLVAYSQGFQTLGRIQSGQTWNFQFWYRDTQGPCGGTTNFSNGVQVAFGP